MKVMKARVMKAKFLLLLIIISLISATLLTSCKNQTQEPNTTEVCFDKKCITAEIADTPKQRATGLMFRQSLPEDKGMVFVFDKPSIYQFWMKNTIIPLDIMFLDMNKKIIDIEHAIPCKEAKCPKYGPMQDSLYVIEVTGGFADKYGIQTGEIVTFEDTQ